MAFVVGGLCMVVAFGILAHQQREFRHVDATACSDRVHQFDALHDVIVKSYGMTRPSAALLAAFPQLRPLYTPGNPQYEEQVASARERRDEVLSVLGARPDC